ncbi:MAG: hypothetical protein P8Y94_10625, partial [Acidobacteriota bacterium]
MDKDGHPVGVRGNAESIIDLAGLLIIDGKGVEICPADPVGGSGVGIQVGSEVESLAAEAWIDTGGHQQRIGRGRQPAERCQDVVGRHAGCQIRVE